MSATEAVADARRVMEICNACRYCEGFCAVFPAMELHRSFEDGDLTYLANLCHDCRGCYYACQYAPPHEFGINLPQMLTRVRAESYEDHAWPQPLAGLFHRNGVVVSLVAAFGLALVLILTMALQSPEALFAARPAAPGSFYEVIPLNLMVVVALAVFGFSMLALIMGGVRFWRTAGTREKPSAAGFGQALHDILTLRYLGGAGDGCNDLDDGFGMRRRRFHHCLAYGFLLCFAATTIGFVYNDFLGWVAPYALFSLPVVLGTLGGVGLLIGATGLSWIKMVADRAPMAKAQLGPDMALLFLLALVALTGLVLLAGRTTGAMGILLAVHLGLVLALFLVLPYSKFVHGLYRSLALLRYAFERRPMP